MAAELVMHWPPPSSPPPQPSDAWSAGSTQHRTLVTHRFQSLVSVLSIIRITSAARVDQVSCRTLVEPLLTCRAASTCRPRPSFEPVAITSTQHIHTVSPAEYFSLFDIRSSSGAERDFYASSDRPPTHAVT
jgi:hypothetical protein